MMLMMLMMQPLFRLGYPDDAHDDAYDAYDGDLGKVSSFCNSALGYFDKFLEIWTRGTV